jgi:DNA-binding LacI/PurR family transcriptional regulator
MGSRFTRKQSTVTSFDVARLAGVSPSTVSLVMTGKAEGRVSEETQQKVRQASEDLSYQINAAARSLRLGDSHAIGLFVPNVLNPFFAKVLQGAQRKAYEAGYNVILMDMMDNPEWQSWLAKSMSARMIDGCILYTPELVLTDTIRKARCCAVLVEVESPGFTCLVIDIEEGARAAVQHLIDLGHRRIAFLDADYEAVTFTLRRKAYRETLQKAGIGYDPGYTGQTKYGIDNTIRAAYQVLSWPNPPTAIFCADDYFVPGVYKAARQLNLRIPEDLSVVGYDNSELARMLEPELTSIDIPAEELGEESVRMILEFLKQEHPFTRHIATRLVVRNSTAPPS